MGPSSTSRSAGPRRARISAAITSTARAEEVTARPIATTGTSSSIADTTAQAPTRADRRAAAQASAAAPPSRTTAAQATSGRSDDHAG